MPLKTLSLDGVWKLKDTEHSKNADAKYCAAALGNNGWIDVSVPGDIHPALLEKGRISNPFKDVNTESCKWTGHKDWWFRKDVKIPKNFESGRVEMVFDGVDTYATLYVNGQKAGEMSNMFRRYNFDISDKVNFGKDNTIALCIHATKEVIEARDTSNYMACFYTPRIFARKAQCQFSWDWAPHLPSLGIYRSASIQMVKGGNIDDVYVRSKTDGHVHMLITLDRESRNISKNQKLTLSVTISDGQKSVQKDVTVEGIKNIANFKLKNPKLWWPYGYGKPNLYNYSIELLQGQKVLDASSGSFGIREVELLQDPNGGNIQKFQFKINGQYIFCTGANWVPADCFPGTVSVERYEHLIRLTREAGFNMLRVWGGGIYEDEAFYRLCDENGIMVWQDMMFACSDIPDNDHDFTLDLIPEFEYQVQRLRNHPCITHWCGGNEKTGSFAENITTGKLVTHYLARGVIQDLCPDVAYTPSSPISITDVGNDPYSGDTHGGTYEEAFQDDITKFREHIDRKKAVFMSEFGLHGPVQMRSLKKFISQENLWPINDVWEHHVQDNPYNSLPETFVQVQYKCASKLFHEPKDAADFVKVAGTFHAEYLYAEFQHHRRRQPVNSGALIWMLNDCWPCASWSIIDYYGLPKQVYYYLKRACRPVVLSFRKVKGGYDLYLTHNLTEELSGEVTIYRENVETGESEILENKQTGVGRHSSEVIVRVSNKAAGKDKNSYLRVSFQSGQGNASEIYFHNLWKDVDWPKPNLKVKSGKLVEKNGEYQAGIKITADKFARCVNLLTDEDMNAYFSDNFFDMHPGQQKEVIIRAKSKFDPEKLKINHWLTNWD